MKLVNFLKVSFLIGSLFFLSCSSKDDDDTITESGYDFDVPDFYTFLDDEGESTVSFGGQTNRLLMGEEILDNFEVFGTTEETLSTMFSEGTGFSGTEITNGTHNIRSKTAASDGYFSTNLTGAELIKEGFEGYISAQAADFNEAYDSLEEVPEATAGSAGYVVESDSETVRLINADGFEYVQIFNKGLIGAFTLDQIINNYLIRCLDTDFQEANTNNVLDGDNNYTLLEHYWDEAYGYIYANTDNDSFLFKYIGRAEEDADFAGIQADILEAFLVGRAAIVANDYDVVAEQVEFLQETLSTIIGIRAVYYLENGITSLNSSLTFGDACHDLSEGYGFIYSLQFTRNPATGEPYVSAETVAGYIETLESGNGLWDFANDTTELENMSIAIAEQFDFTVAQASSTAAVSQ